MSKKIFRLIFLCVGISLCTTHLYSQIYVGAAENEITPPIGTPSAGYIARMGKGMTGIHDPLLATAMVIEADNQKLVFCGVDHLGFSYDMVQAIIHKLQSLEAFRNSLIYIGSSHTHSGSGSFLSIPIIGEMLAGPYDAALTEKCIEKVVNTIIEADQKLQPALLGIGYGSAHNLSRYRAQWPENVNPLSEITVIKATTLEGLPLAVVFNFPVHPTILNADNRQFSADFVGYSRQEVKKYLGQNATAIYFNGAQGDIAPNIDAAADGFEEAARIGKSLAASVIEAWDAIEALDSLTVSAAKESYNLIPQRTPYGLLLDIPEYPSELNSFVLNGKHAFVSIPGELSCCYHKQLMQERQILGFEHISILGLVNDAHGYILLPEAWHRKTAESALSFGGEYYGEELMAKIYALLNTLKFNL